MKFFLNQIVAASTIIYLFVQPALLLLELFSIIHIPLSLLVAPLMLETGIILVNFIMHLITYKKPPANWGALVN